MGILPISDIQVDLAWFEVSDSSFIHEKQDNFSFVSRCSFCYFILLILCVKTAIALSCTWDGNTEVIHGFGPSIFCSLTVENAPSPLSLWWHFKTDGPLSQLATGNPQCHQVHWWTMVCSVFLTMAPSWPELPAHMEALFENYMIFSMSSSLILWKLVVAMLRAAQNRPRFWL